MYKLPLVIEKSIGKGTFGTVKKARLYQDSEYTFAVKEVQDKYAISEIKILNKLKSPNKYEKFRKYIVQYFFSFKQENFHHLVFQMGQMNLDDVINKYDINDSFITSACYHIISGLTFIHSARIIHCDLKPHNIILVYENNEYNLKIIDFGNSLDLKYFEQFNNYNLVTPCYRAPEIILWCEYSHTFAIDIWSLGCILYELLTKKRLFDKFEDYINVTKMLTILGKPEKSILSLANITDKDKAKINSYPSKKKETNFQDIKNPIFRRILQHCLNITFHQRPSAYTLLQEFKEKEYKLNF